MRRVWKPADDLVHARLLTFSVRKCGQSEDFFTFSSADCHPTCRDEAPAWLSDFTLYVGFFWCPSIFKVKFGEHTFVSASEFVSVLHLDTVPGCTYIISWPGNHSSPASASLMLGLRLHYTKPRWQSFLLINVSFFFFSIIFPLETFHCLCIFLHCIMPFNMLNILLLNLLVLL